MVTLVKLPMGAGRPPPRVTPGKGDVGELPAMAPAAADLTASAA
jgi:hypothetical protein